MIENSKMAAVKYFWGGWAIR